MRPVNPHYNRLLTALGSSDESGAVLIALIIAIVLLGAIGVTIHTLSTSETYHSLTANQSMQAYYLAESGYRYLAGEYRNAGDIYNKMTQLESLHDATRTLSNGGRFTLEIHPYFFITNTTYTRGDNQLTVRVPGEFPANFVLPDNTRLYIGGHIYDASLTGQTPPDVSFELTPALHNIVPENSRVCLVATPPFLPLPQEIDPGGTLVLEDETGLLFPHQYGQVGIRINGKSNIFAYSTTHPGPESGQIQLLNFQGIDKHSRLEFPLSISESMDIILKPFLEVDITGEIGARPYGARRKIPYAIPIAKLQDEMLLEKFKNLENWEAPNDNIQVDEILPSDWGNHQSGALLGGPGKGPDPTEDPENSGKLICSIFLLLDMPAHFEDAWQRAGKFLSYDAQVKHEWHDTLSRAADGICVRWHTPGGTGLYQGLAVSFMNYSENDFIPDNIKPPGLANTPLLVVWEQRVTGSTITRRWIAYKDLTQPIPPDMEPDMYILDGPVFNDFSSLFVRMEEKEINDVKTNELRVFYGDASRLESRNGVMPNDEPRDKQRKVYPPSWAESSPGILWPVNDVEDWTADHDYMTLVTWDELNPLATGYELMDPNTLRTVNFVTPEDDFSDRNEIALHAFGDLSKTILFDDMAVQILEKSGLAVPLQQ